jgi:hypothetical protein
MLRMANNECPNLLCKCQFVGSQNLKIHLSKTKVCTDALFKMANNDDNNPDVPLGIDGEEANKPIDASFEPDSDVEDVPIPWDCVA